MQGFPAQRTAPTPGIEAALASGPPEAQWQAAKEVGGFAGVLGLLRDQHGVRDSLCPASG